MQGLVAVGAGSDAASSIKGPLVQQPDLHRLSPRVSSADGQWQDVDKAGMPLPPSRSPSLPPPSHFLLLRNSKTLFGGARAGHSPGD